MSHDESTVQDNPAKGGPVSSRDSQQIQASVRRPTVPHPDAGSAPIAARNITASAWNTDSLGWRLGVDAASAASAAAAICPIITVIDRAIIEKAAKGMPIRESLSSSLKTLVTRPHRFLVSTPFLLIYTLYSCTYITANFIDTSVSTLNDRSFDSISAGPAKFSATALVNMSICVYKDTRFAKLFGAQASQSSTQGQPAGTASPASSSQRGPVHHPMQQQAKVSPPKIPKVSLSLFCLRDSLTIFASFNLPPLVSPFIPDSLASTPSSKASLAQFVIPASVQLFSTPLHLLGLDLYNRQPAGGIPAADRWIRVKRDWIPSCAARIGRILPAYGVGGVLNTKIRQRLMGDLEDKSYA